MSNQTYPALCPDCLQPLTVSCPPQKHECKAVAVGPALTCLPSEELDRLRAEVASLKGRVDNATQEVFRQTCEENHSLRVQLAAVTDECKAWVGLVKARDDQLIEAVKDQLAVAKQHSAALEQEISLVNGRVERMREAVQGWIDEHESHGPCQCEDAHFSTPEHSTPAYTCPSCSWNASLEPLRAALSALPQQVKSEDARDADFDLEAERIFTEELTGAVGRINPDATCIDDIFIFDAAPPDIPGDNKEKS